jgi:hypothetical protein
MLFGRPLLPGVFSKEFFMRIRVPGRFIAAMAILAAVLCLLPASSNIAVAKPIGGTDLGPPSPDGGDNDGVVLKSKIAVAPTTMYAAGSTGNVTTLKSVRIDISSLRMFFAVTKLDYWSFWLR